MEKRSSLKKKLPFRAWYYFRTGYSQYFSFILALGNMYTLTYYLAIANNPALDSIFPNFYIYAIAFTVVGFPLLVVAGYLHMKKSHAYSAEMDITVESNPYSYRLNPGIQTECVAPLYLELLRLGRKSLSDEKVTDEELKRIQELESKLSIIAKGESLPMPRNESKATDPATSTAWPTQH
ncbi:MAG: hypothetical protein ACREAZ_05565 [Nitrososphaera sp.]